ncbi:hypothetical protein D9M71_510320 [compost metagenome]
MRGGADGEHLATHAVVDVLAQEGHCPAELLVVGCLLQVVAVQPEAEVVGHPVAGRVVEVEQLAGAVVGVVVFLVEAVGGLERQLGAVAGQPGRGKQRLVGVEVVAGIGQAVGIVVAGGQRDLQRGAQGQVLAQVPEDDRRHRGVALALAAVMQAEYRDLLAHVGLPDVATQAGAEQPQRAQVVQARDDRVGGDLHVRHLAAEGADVQLPGLVVVVVEIEGEHVVRQVVHVQRQDEETVGSGADVVDAVFSGQGRQREASRNGEGDCQRQPGETDRVHG